MGKTPFEGIIKPWGAGFPQGFDGASIARVLHFIGKDEVSALTYTVTNSTAPTDCTTGDGGLLTMTNATADNDVIHAMTTRFAKMDAAGKKLAAIARIAVSATDYTLHDFLFGFFGAITNGQTVPTAVDFIAFHKAEDTALWKGIRGKDATTVATGQTDMTLETSTGVTPTSGTYYNMAILWEMTSASEANITLLINGVVVGYYEGSTDIPNDEEMAVGVIVQNGSAAAATLRLDALAFAYWDR